MKWYVNVIRRVVGVLLRRVVDLEVPGIGSLGRQKKNDNRERERDMTYREG